jgi:hypothetical protein
VTTATTPDLAPELVICMLPDLPVTAIRTLRPLKGR